MMIGKQSRILAQCCELIDQRVKDCPEPGAKQFANTFLEGAVSAFVLIGKHDLAESMSRMLGELQASLSWAQFRQKNQKPVGWH